MLRSVRALEKLKVIAADGRVCGRVRDVYFDDRAWRVQHLVASIEPSQFGQKQILLAPHAVARICPEDGAVHLKIESNLLLDLPLAGSVLTVCQQYASMAFSSPGASFQSRRVTEANPHLRSARAVTAYEVEADGASGGTLTDFVLDEASWEIRYLKIEQELERKKLSFHVLPQMVERFTWATRRVLLRQLQPVLLEGEPVVIPAPNFAAA